MHPYLDNLGIRPEAQAFFEAYPPHSQIWVAGEESFAKDIFICESPMDAICFLHFHYDAFNRPEQLFFVSVGAAASKIRVKTGRYHLVFGRDLLGRIWDLKVACLLRNQPVRISYNLQNKLNIYFRSKQYIIDQKLFTLNRFAIKSGYRFNVRTHKPKYQNTFFEQLKYGHQP